MTERREDLISVTVSDGKYTIQQTGPGTWEALRYGEEWPAFRDSGPDNLHIALAHEVNNLRRQVASMSSPIGTFAWAIHLMLWERKKAFRIGEPHIVFEFDGAEGCVFWGYDANEDEFNKHSFTTEAMLAKDWMVTA